MNEFLTRLPYLAAALIPALTFHEFGHAYMAHRFGDDTAKQSGRLTLNPLAHLDPLGTVAIFLIGFGWGKPVPIEASRFKSSWGAFFVAFSGPLMNFALAAVFAFLLNAGTYRIFGASNSDIFGKIFAISLQLNLALAFFNLIPVGPLDGEHMLARLLPRSTSLKFSEWNTQYGGMILFGLIIFDSFTNAHILSRIVLVPTQITMNWLLNLGT